MAVMAREAWTDERLDDLNARVEGIDRRMDAGFADVREEFRAVRAETAQIYRTIITGFGVTVVGFAGTIATILAQG
jgi:hypothetical protein